MAERIAPEESVRLVAKELRAGSAVVLRDLDASFAAGQVHAVVGGNGSGKTTLLRALAGDDVAGVTGLWWFGSDARAMGARDQARIRACVFGDAIPAFGLTCEEFVGLGVQTAVGSRGIRDLAMQALAQCSVAHHARRSIDVLSGGELARVRLAQALAMQPRLLILDEPDAALDAQARLQVHALLSDVPATVVFVSHDIAAAHAHADQVWRVHKGRLTLSGADSADV